MKIFTENDLALMWCRMNSWKHPINDKRNEIWKESGFVHGAQHFIEELIGHQKCREYWNGPYREDKKLGPSEAKP